MSLGNALYTGGSLRDTTLRAVEAPQMVGAHRLIRAELTYRFIRR
jgi:hypothetical protein